MNQQLYTDILDLSLITPKIGIVFIAISTFVYFFSFVLNTYKPEKSIEQIELIQFFQKIGHYLAAIGVLICILGIYTLVITIGVLIISAIIFMLSGILKTIANIVKCLFRK